MRKILIVLIIFFINSFIVLANDKIPIKLLNIYDGDTINAEYKNENIFKKKRGFIAPLFMCSYEFLLAPISGCIESRTLVKSSSTPSL